MKSLFLILSTTLIGAATMIVQADPAAAAAAVDQAAQCCLECCPEWLCRLLGCCDPCPAVGNCCLLPACCGG
jgi:hypothetical protein